MVRGNSLILDYSSEVILGHINNVSRVVQTAVCSVPATTNVPHDIWPDGVTQPLLTTATALEVVSTSVNDTAAGANAQTVIIVGLDASYNSISQTITLNGTTPVAVPTPLIRINSMRCGRTIVTTGTVSNDGTINLQDAGGGTIRNIIAAGAGNAQTTLYTPPAGYTLIIYSIELQIPDSAGGTPRGADARLVFRNTAGFATQSRLISTTDAKPFTLEALTGIPVLEKSDFWAQVTYTSANNMRVGCAWEGHLHKN